MMMIKRAFVAFWNDEAGATAIEYALIAALVAVAIIAGLSLLGVNLGDLFTRLAGCISNPTAGWMAP